MKQYTTRRSFLRLVAGAPLLACGIPPAFAAQTGLIDRLIQQARAHDQVAQRMDVISRALRGVRYQADTLIGGPSHPEQFVVRDDAFDCVTFCEVVLAAALASDLAAFEASLRRIRYEHGEVRWDERNHYFATWSLRSIENQICRRVALGQSITIDKTVNWPKLGPRRVSMAGIPRATLLANRHLLASGDIIGFVSGRSDLDFFHTGLVAFEPTTGSLLLRHASRGRGRIMDEPMDRFVAANSVKYVTLLRAVDSAPNADLA
jgi:hypothetical protein